MAKLIEADTRLDAWIQAADYLLVHGPTLNLILAINSPAAGGSDAAIDEFLAENGQFSMHTVAETIFPGVEYRHRGLQGVLDFYPDEVYPAIEKHPSIHWGAYGTYAYRLVRRRAADGMHINPLSVHSSYAYLNGSKAAMRKLLENLRQNEEGQDGRKRFGSTAA